MADESEQAAIRRRLRWLTLAEILGVAALLISALTLWNNYAERRSGELSKAAEQRQATARAHRLVLRASPDKDGERLTLAAAGAQVIQGQTIAFPKALGVDLVHFGVVVVVNIMIGLVTPPYGLLLFVMSNMTGQPLIRIVREALPFIIMAIVVLALITAVPDTVLWLPRLMGYKG